ncbi:hypothetical protein [Trinickia diaoshuihuensis]|uniref:hypothetical protein n=1 Tax=Trinickia diaoshuihuensis TaxID=2292265 RepID=UPI000E24D01F|nr:hypothetical protein [Trinickia diaoshuihuensis]
MPFIDAALKTYEILAAVHMLPDQAALTTTEAALFLRLSPKSLERMRSKEAARRMFKQAAGARAVGTRNAFT